MWLISEMIHYTVSLKRMSLISQRSLCFLFIHTILRFKIWMLGVSFEQVRQTACWLVAKRLKLVNHLFNVTAQFKTVLWTVKFSTATVNSPWFDLNFTCLCCSLVFVHHNALQKEYWLWITKAYTLGKMRVLNMLVKCTGHFNGLGVRCLVLSGTVAFRRKRNIKKIGDICRTSV